MCGWWFGGDNEAKEAGGRLTVLLQLLGVCVSRRRRRRRHATNSCLAFTKTITCRTAANPNQSINQSTSTYLHCKWLSVHHQVSKVGAVLSGGAVCVSWQPPQRIHVRHTVRHLDLQCTSSNTWCVGKEGGNAGEGGRVQQQAKK